MSKDNKLPNIFDVLARFIQNIFQSISNNKTIAKMYKENLFFKMKNQATVKKIMNWNSPEGKEEKKLLENLLQLHKEVYEYKVDQITPEQKQEIAKRCGYTDFIGHHNHHDTNYLGIAVADHEKKEILLVHRSTKLDGVFEYIETGKIDKLMHEASTDFKDDASLFLGLDIKDRIEQAKLYIAKIQKEYKGYTIIQSGFSLGGAVAQGIYKEQDIKTYVFDSPGYPSSPVAEERKNGIYYFDNPENFVNSCGAKLEAANKIHYVMPKTLIFDFLFNENETLEANKINLPINLFDFMRKGYYEHDIGRILQDLKSINPVVVNDFPTTVFEAQNKLMNNHAFWKTFLNKYAKNYKLTDAQQNIVIDYIKNKCVEQYSMFNIAGNLITPKQISLAAAIYKAFAEDLADNSTSKILQAIENKKKEAKKVSKTDDAIAQTKPKLFADLIEENISTAEINLDNQNDSMEIIG
jgi:hypothetical protein